MFRGNRSVRFIRLAVKPGMGQMVFVLCFLWLCVAANPSAAEDEPSFAMYKLSVPDYLHAHWIEDLDNDGLKDILVVHKKGLPPEETRWVSLFWQGT